VNRSIQQIKRIYFLVTALRWLAVGLTLPVFVLFMQSRGINLMQLGIVMGFYSATIVVLELPTGGLADAVGRKKVALLAHSIDILAGLFFFFSFSFWGFLMGMILMGVARALNSGALDAWYVDSLQAADPGIDIQPALAQVGTVTLLALGIGTLAGGALPTLFSDLPAAETALISPLSTTLLVSMAIQFILLAIIAKGIHEPRRTDVAMASWHSGLLSIPEIVGDALNLTRRNRSLPLLMGATLVGGFTLSGVETFWQPHFANLLGGSAEKSWLFGLVLAVSFLAGMGGNMLSIPLSKRLNHRYALVAGLARALQSIALLGMAFLQPAIAFAGSFWVFYLGNTLNNSPHETLVNNEIPAGRRSAMLSTQSLAVYVGAFLGSTLLGTIAESSNISNAWILAAVVSMVSLVLYARVAGHLSSATINHDEKAPLPESS
jgi:DHA1 family quinolone resistance protein-like MFS transporter